MRQRTAEPGTLGLSPIHPTIGSWLAAGFRQQRWATLVALLAGWTGLTIALWAALFGAIAGFFIGGITGTAALTAVVHGGSLGGAGGVTGVVGAILGAGLGAIGGFVVVYVTLLFHSVISAIVALVFAGALSAVIAAGSIALEPIGLRARRYRPMSRREAELIDPIVADVAGRLGLQRVPPVIIRDGRERGAWSHCRAIVLDRGLLGEVDAGLGPPETPLRRDELAAIIAHELCHWAEGHLVAARVVWAAALPVVALLNAGMWVTRRVRAGWIVWIGLWPSWVVVQWLIAPLASARQRENEYRADAVAATATSPDAMRRALVEVGGQVEDARTGWEAALLATHPPLELRLQALEDHVPVAMSMLERTRPPAAVRSSPRQSPDSRVAASVEAKRQAESDATQGATHDRTDAEPTGAGDDIDQHSTSGERPRGSGAAASVETPRRTDTPDTPTVTDRRTDAPRSGGGDEVERRLIPDDSSGGTTPGPARREETNPQPEMESASTVDDEGTERTDVQDNVAHGSVARESTAPREAETAWPPAGPPPGRVSGQSSVPRMADSLAPENPLTIALVARRPWKAQIKSALAGTARVHASRSPKRIVTLVEAAHADAVVIAMAGTDAVVALRELRATSTTTHLPIVVVDPDGGREAQLRDAGADVVLPPSQVEDLARLVTSAVRERRTAH